jgi:hypothetical protein
LRCPRVVCLRVPRLACPTVLPALRRKLPRGIFCCNGVA